ncbi:hypothetical protein [Halalkalibacter okhensis]|uniref:Uncharacterized protein n=1 Tax=Halalkalibacter okhensis TaxID=333138 RepID=A0A0B0ICW3_9BACI|nr:hypothetical protein [Halalkalibacter okhensis]KHF39155.1 hypothetical protein LQ50_17160 [Halalkalibacter okhensis]
MIFYLKGGVEENHHIHLASKQVFRLQMSEFGSNNGWFGQQIELIGQNSRVGPKVVPNLMGNWQYFWDKEPVPAVPCYGRV